MAYERHLEENIFALHEHLTNGSYRHSGYQPFTIHDPKQRQIHKATVQDRLVHQVLVSAIEPLFEPQFIYDSYSCRKDKGTHAAVNRLQSFLILNQLSQLHGYDP
jgi:RNA-directed DNA polymerase